MKNFVKIIIVFEIATSFFPVYLMGMSVGAIKNFYNRDFPCANKSNSISDRKKLPFRDSFKASDTYIFIHSDSQKKLFEQSSSVLKAIKVIENPDTETKEKILDTFSQEVETFSQEVEKNFNYTFYRHDIYDRACVIEHSENPVSLYMILKNWLKFDSRNVKYSALKLIGREKSFRSFLLAIKQKKSMNKNEKQSALVACARNQLKIETPEQIIDLKQIIDLMLSFVPECNFDEEDKELIEQEARLKIDKE